MVRALPGELASTPPLNWVDRKNIFGGQFRPFSLPAAQIQLIFFRVQKKGLSPPLGRGRPNFQRTLEQPPLGLNSIMEALRPMDSDHRNQVSDQSKNFVMNTADASGFGGVITESQSVCSPLKRKPMEIDKADCSDHGNNELKAGLECVQTSLRTALHEVNIMKHADVVGAVQLTGVLEGILRTVKTLLRDSKSVRSTVQYHKKPKGMDTLEMRDAATDTILTPRWWDSDDMVNSKSKVIRSVKGPKPNAAGVTLTDVENDLVMEADAENWSKVVRRGKRNSKDVSSGLLVRGTGRADFPSLPSEKTVIKSRSKNNAAVLIKVKNGSTYEETLQKIKSSGVNPDSLGASVKGMRRTRSGDLLVDLGRSAKSRDAAEPLRKALIEKLGDSVGPVTKLGSPLVMELIDLDAVTTRDEVLVAVSNALMEGLDKDDQVVIEACKDVNVLSMWKVKNGHQIATVNVPRRLMTRSIDHVVVGWIRCRFRPRRPEVSRCHRCHGFGHMSYSCTGPNLTDECRRCGLKGHYEKECQAGPDKCVACDRAGHPPVPHRPGSGGCMARWQASSRSTSKPING